MASLSVRALVITHGKGEKNKTHKTQSSKPQDTAQACAHLSTHTTSTCHESTHTCLTNGFTGSVWGGREQGRITALACSLMPQLRPTAGTGKNKRKARHFAHLPQFQRVPIGALDGHCHSAQRKEGKTCVRTGGGGEGTETAGTTQDAALPC